MTDLKTIEAQRRARQMWQVGVGSIILAILFLGATGWKVYSNWLSARRDAQLAAQNTRLLRDLNALVAQLTTAETGQRGYILTGSERYLQPYNGALRPLQQTLRDLSELAATRPDLRRSILHIIVAQTKVKLAELAKTIQLRKEVGFDAALQEVMTNQGQAAMDEVKQECARVAELQYRDLDQRSQEAQQHQREAILLAGGGGLLISSLMVAGFVALISGARQQAQLAENLADSREIFETTLTSIGDAVVATNTTGQVTFINPVAAKLTGYSREAAIGKNLKEIFRIVNESTRCEEENPFDRVIQTGAVVGLANHTVLLRQDGTEVPIDDSGAPIRDVAGRINGVVLVFRNVTERRRSEAALQQSHDEVLKVNEDLRQFSYAATHDLQEPLRTIVVFSQLLARSYKHLLDERGQHLMKTVEDAAHRMSLLVEDLLAYTRAGSVESCTARIAVDSQEIFRDTLVQLHGAIEESGAVIQTGELPVVWSEPAQLSQVFQNLLSNAIKYRKPDTHPVIRISSSIEGDRATFQVADNGMGFKQEYSERIFQLFQRLHGRSIPGTGIGLALCRRIIERHGGRIWARSEENIGTSFFFTLPLAAKPRVNGSMSN